MSRCSINHFAKLEKLLVSIKIKINNDVKDIAFMYLEQGTYFTNTNYFFELILVYFTPRLKPQNVELTFF